MNSLRPGRDYPGSVGELLAWFSSDADCRDYLEWLRWPDGFVCSICGHAGGWRLGDGRFMCAGCSHRTSVTAGTIFDRTRTPLTVWFNVCWAFATAKDGISALSLQRTLEIGSYQTAWAELHRLRSAGSCSSQSATTRFATANSSDIPDHERRRRSRPEQQATRPPSNAPPEQTLARRRPAQLRLSGEPESRYRLNTDAGSQYTSFAFTDRLIEAGIDSSIGSVGDYDNALADTG